jgi:hypothetical protein
MYVCYVDESGDPGRNGSTYLLLGAAAIFEGRWRTVREDLDQLILKYFPPPGARPPEIHLADLRRGKAPFRRMTPTQRSAIVADLCNVATNNLSTELRFFAVIAHKPTWYANNPGKTGNDLYSDLFEDLSSRFDLYLRHRFAEGAPNKGIIIADPHKPDLSSALKAKYGVFQQLGTRWGRVYNLIETVFFLPSHESPGLQLADLCSYGVWRVLTANDTSIVGPIAPMFDREPLSSSRDPGKWHGVKCLTRDAATQAILDALWH